MSIHLPDHIASYEAHPILKRYREKKPIAMPLRQPIRDDRADAVDQLYADVAEQNKLAVVMHDARLDRADRLLRAHGVAILCLIIVIAAIIFVVGTLQYRFSQMEGHGTKTIQVVPLGQSAPITSFASTGGGHYFLH